MVWLIVEENATFTLHISENKDENFFSHQTSGPSNFSLWTSGKVPPPAYTLSSVINMDTGVFVT